MSVVTKRRQTQAERSAGTKTRVLQAAIRCLHRYGYSTTTTLLVAEEAGVSRGAMLHQFPTKTDIMLFVVRSVFDEEVARFKERLRSPRHSESDLMQVMWDTLNRPGGVAALEVLLGSRSDKDLAEKLVLLQAQIEREAFEIASSVHPEIRSVFSTPAGVRLVIWAMRGFAVANLVSDDPKKALDMMALFRRIMNFYWEAERQQRKKSKPAK